jgi:hypothetical protein
LKVGDLLPLASVSCFQFVAVEKTTVETPRKTSARAVMTKTRILPTKVMVSSTKSGKERTAHHPCALAATK